MVTLAAGTPVPLGARGSHRLKVVASTSDPGARATEVGGDRLEVQAIIQENQDPHFVQAKPSYGDFSA
jgi:ABC-type Zn uptake system ZnuABC Zn-binding protein ZnuA